MGNFDKYINVNGRSINLETMPKEQLETVLNELNQSEAQIRQEINEILQKLA